MADEPLILPDTSAWHHSRHPEVAPLWERYLQEDLLATTEIVRLEYLYSARTGADYDRVAEELMSLHEIPTTHAGLRRALEVQQILAHRRSLHHRVSVPDLVIAAVAELHGTTVWHYDADYDRIAEVTGQPMEWVAPRGSL